MPNFDWVPFYEECADILITYEHNRDDLIEIAKRIYEEAGINMPKMDYDDIIDFDPFTFFGIFNKSSMTETNRIKLVTKVKELLTMSTPVPTGFDGVPTVMNQNATFYYFVGDREDDDIDKLWELFISARKYAKEKTIVNKELVMTAFDKVIDVKGIGNSKLTMGIYWIGSDTYFNFDRRSQWYIYDSGEVPNSIVNHLPTINDKLKAKDYFKIIEVLNTYLKSSESKFNNFRELSFAAWNLSNEVNQSKKEIANANHIKETDEILLDGNKKEIKYWVYSPGNGATMWKEFSQKRIMAVSRGEIGDLNEFKSKDEMKDAMKQIYDGFGSYKNSGHMTWQFINEMKIGDVIFAKLGTQKLIGRGIVKSDYYFDSNRSDKFKHQREVEWTHIGEWNFPGNVSTKMLTDITPYTEFVNNINRIFEVEAIDDEEEIDQIFDSYTPKQFLNDVYMRENDYLKLVKVLRNKKNIILQGAPGVGKTYVAKRLAYSIMGEKDFNRVMMIQFHQSYSYEDFIMGFRPTESGFELKKGPFYHFCKEAEIDLENDYFFIIDEINRGNLSKIFGELFMLIENDKRGVTLQLLYSDEKFSVPSNIHIIGMMNTADRSLAMLDYALRRRFAFFEMKPGFETDGFKAYQKAISSERFDKLINTVKSLNNEIAQDESLGDGFSIGHSYFCSIEPEDFSEEMLDSIVEFELIPLIKEYWFDEPDNVRNWSEELRSAIM